VQLADGKRNSLPRSLLCQTQENLSQPGVVAGGDETKVQTLCVKCGFFQPPRGLECVRNGHAFPLRWKILSAVESEVYGSPGHPLSGATDGIPLLWAFVNPDATL